jgi:hypothetical protein
MGTMPGCSRLAAASASAKRFRYFGRPRAQADHFERDGAIETFLMCPINNTLTAPADFLQQLVVTKLA